MACIHAEIILDVSADKAWAALRDVGAAHRLFAGVLTDCSLQGDIRAVTFAQGNVARERIIDINEADRRVAYAVLGSGFEHYSASMQIVPVGEGRCRFVWFIDFLPGERASSVRPLVEQGCGAMKRVLEGTLG